MGILVALYFLEADCQKRGLNFFCGDMKEKRSYSDDGLLFIGRFKVGSVPGMGVALEAAKNAIKIHHEYEERPLIKSYNFY